jgi:hypothetical protein
MAGPPAAGKSALMAALTGGMDRVLRLQPFAHELLLDRDGTPIAAELGKRRNGFPGTDTLSMSVAPLAKAWLANCPVDVVLGEGDRLAHMGFLVAARDAGFTVDLVSVTATDAELGKRRGMRAAAQNAQWMKGRETKVTRLVADATEAGFDVATLNSTRTPAAELAAQLRAWVPWLDVLPC